MALRKATNDKREGLAPPAPGGGAGAPGADGMGDSVEECVAVGQALVESGHFQGEMLAPSLADGKGDLWAYGQIMLTKYGIGRAEYAQALGRATGLPVADPRNVEPDKELGGEVEERIARKFKFVPVKNEGGKLWIDVA